MSEVVAILLAAGAGSRYRAAGGREASKLIADVGGAPLVRRAARAAAALAPLIVVTGHARAEVEAALSGVKARFVHNPDYVSGLASSLRRGLAAAPPSAEGALIMLGDMPRVSARIVGRLLEAFAQRPDALAIIPVYQGERGNPVLLARALFAEAAELQGDEGARKILRRVDPARLVEIGLDDEGVKFDVDTPAALALMRNEESMSVVIYHNPRCATSRNALTLIREAGVEPTIIEYLKNPPSAETLKGLLARIGISARELIRRKEALYAELDLANPKWSEEELIGFMVAHPILIERPIVVSEKGARLARPKEKALEIL